MLHLPKDGFLWEHLVPALRKIQQQSLCCSITCSLGFCRRASRTTFRLQDRRKSNDSRETSRSTQRLVMNACRKYPRHPLQFRQCRCTSTSIMMRSSKSWESGAQSPSLSGSPGRAALYCAGVFHSNTTLLLFCSSRVPEGKVLMF